jgi:hypothetical protein
MRQYVVVPIRPAVQLVAGVTVSVGIILAATLPWATWPGNPGVQPTVTVSGVGTRQGFLVLIVAVLGGTCVLAGTAVKKR